MNSDQEDIEFEMTLVEGAIERAVRSIEIDSVRSAVTYSLFPRGKRIRPRLLIALVKTLGGKITNDVLCVAVSLELIHSASLIHDDLPAIDDDQLRRGKASHHVEFGEDVAILTGDFLYGLAFHELAKIDDAFLQKQALLAVSEANCNVQIGQLLDIKNVETPEDLKRVHSLKTGSLFRAAAKCAYLFRSDDCDVPEESAIRFGELFGAYFQAINDLEDPVQEVSVARAAGSDRDSGRGTVMQWSHQERLQYIRTVREDALQLADELEPKVPRYLASQTLKALFS